MNGFLIQSELTGRRVSIDEYFEERRNDLRRFRADHNKNDYFCHLKKEYFYSCREYEEYKSLLSETEEDSSAKKDTSYFFNREYARQIELFILFLKREYEINGGNTDSLEREWNRNKSQANTKKSVPIRSYIGYWVEEGQQFNWMAPKQRLADCIFIMIIEGELPKISSEDLGKLVSDCFLWHGKKITISNFRTQLSRSGQLLTEGEIDKRKLSRNFDYGIGKEIVKVLFEKIYY